jgi:hypothetical protein
MRLNERAGKCATRADEITVPATMRDEADLPKRIRNQQVSGSSPLVGSTKSS